MGLTTVQHYTTVLHVINTLLKTMLFYRAYETLLIVPLHGSTLGSRDYCTNL